jgi:hypothetical protein
LAKTPKFLPVIINSEIEAAQTLGKYCIQFGDLDIRDLDEINSGKIALKAALSS